MVALNEENAISVWRDGEINFHSEVLRTATQLKIDGFEEATRDEFNDFFIEQKKGLDNLIKEI